MTIQTDKLMAALFKEALSGVEKELALENEGWLQLGSSSADILSDQDRVAIVQKARLYAMRDPMARQAIRLWTDYTFGPGMTWDTEDEAAGVALNTYWSDIQNSMVLSAKGQRKSSDKLLIDGEIFFALFLGNGQSTIRRIDPLEITELVSDPDDLENVRFYKREWSDTLGQQHIKYYRSMYNVDNQPVKDRVGTEVKSDNEAIVYHLAINTIGQRGNSLLLPAIDWIKLHRQFLAARTAIMLAAARFIWKSKVEGGQTAVDAVKAKFEGELPAAGSVLIENTAVDTTPVVTNTNARNAYDDDRMLKLQIAAAVGIPEQYFGDISIGNLATAKTVELPMMKMFQSYQQIWADTYDEIDMMVLKKSGMETKDLHIDRDFPSITPEDTLALATAITQVTTVFPEFTHSRDVMQVALLAIGVTDTNAVLDELLNPKDGDSQEAAMLQVTKALRELKKVIQNGSKPKL